MTAPLHFRHQVGEYELLYGLVSVPFAKLKMGSKYSCAFSGCDKVYSKPSLLEDHENTHTDIRPFICTACPKAYFKRKDLKVHEERKHTQLEKTQTCPECKKSFYTIHELRRHNESCSRKHECMFCHKMFVRNAPYLKHLLKCSSTSKTKKIERTRGLSKNKVRKNKCKEDKYRDDISKQNIYLEETNIDDTYREDVHEGDAHEGETHRDDAHRDDTYGEDKSKHSIYNPDTSNLCISTLTISTLSNSIPTQPNSTTPTSNSVLSFYSSVKCPECAKIYSKPFNMRAHFKAVHERQRHVCYQCHASFAHPHTLRKHINQCSIETESVGKEESI